MVCRTCRAIVEPKIVNGKVHCAQCRQIAKNERKAKDRVWDYLTAAVLAVVVGATVASAVFRLVMGWPL